MVDHKAWRSSSIGMEPKIGFLFICGQFLLRNLYCLAEVVLQVLSMGRRQRERAVVVYAGTTYRHSQFNPPNYFFLADFNLVSPIGYCSLCIWVLPCVCWLSFWGRRKYVIHRLLKIEIHQSTSPMEILHQSPSVSNCLKICTFLTI